MKTRQQTAQSVQKDNHTPFEKILLPVQSEQPKAKRESEFQHDVITNTKVTITINAPGVHITTESPRVILRTVEPSDVDFYQSLYRNAQVMEKFDENGLPRLYKDKRSEKNNIINYAKHYILNKKNGSYTLWRRGGPLNQMTVIEKSTGNKVGFTSFHKANSDIDMTIYGMFHPDYWMKGYGTEVGTLMLRAVLPAIELSGVKKDICEYVVSNVRSDNIGSRKVMHRTGFHCEQAPTLNDGLVGPVKTLTYKAKVKDLINSSIRSEQTDYNLNPSKPMIPLFDLKINKKGSTQVIETNNTFETRQKRYYRSV